MGRRRRGRDPGELSPGVRKILGAIAQDFDTTLHELLGKTATRHLTLARIAAANALRVAIDATGSVYVRPNAEIAWILGYNSHTAITRLQKHGVVPSGLRRRLSDSVLEHILVHRADGRTFYEISKLIGVGQAAIERRYYRARRLFLAGELPNDDSETYRLLAHLFANVRRGGEEARAPSMPGSHDGHDAPGDAQLDHALAD